MRWHGDLKPAKRRWLELPSLPAFSLGFSTCSRWAVAAGVRLRQGCAVVSALTRPAYVRATLLLLGVWAAIVGLPSAAAWVVHRPTAGSVAAWMDSMDAHTPVRVYRMATGDVVTLPLNDYLVNVLAAEVSPDAPPDAMAAAAVAARTYVLRALTHPQASGPTFAAQRGADVTDSAQLDLPWRTIAEQERLFGPRQAAYTARFQQAVLATDGFILTQNGAPVLAFAFPVSAGRTRDALAVLGQPVSYLTSVACPDDLAVAQQPDKRLTPSQLADLLQLPEAAPNPAGFTVSARDSAGYAQTVTYDGRVWSGAEFAARLGLPSAHFQLTSEGGQLLVHCQGIGLGLGMSLHEASVLAARGMSWRDLLAHFYPGTTLTQRP
ncbi:MAG: SpoIID/LytB domain-containing protein [Alicyclobacillus sp.]|nr:SpoIID/LytB domain-containing protein [Alicyclobacillus sp.]